MNRLLTNSLLALALLGGVTYAYADDVDETSKVQVTSDAWKADAGGNYGLAGTGAAPAVTPSGHAAAVQMAENYHDNNSGGVNTLGVMLHQTITNLTPGTYTVTLYANSMFTTGRGFESSMTDGATDVAFVYATSDGQTTSTPITAKVATSTTANGEYTIENVSVYTGTLEIGLRKDKVGTNWHTIQIKSLVRTDTYSDDALISWYKSILSTEITSAKAIVPTTDAITAAITSAETAVNASGVTVETLSTAYSSLQNAENASKSVVYYLYDATNKLFFSRGNAFGTEASADKYGVPFTYDYSTGIINFKDWANVGLHIEDNGTSVYTDNASPTKFTFEATTGGYYLEYVNGTTTSYARHSSGTYGEYVNMTTTQSDAVVWTLKTKAERDAIVNAYPTENKTAVATAAGITGDFDTATKDYVSQVVKTIAPNDYTWAKVSGSDANSSDPREVYQGVGNFTYTATGLAKGLYKVTIQALERDGSNADNVTLANSEYYVTTSYLQAGDQQVRIKGWAEDRAGDENPNSVSDAKTLFDAGKYSTDVYAYVSEDNGSLALKVAVPSHNNGHWFIMGNTVITLLKDGVTEEASNTLISSAETLESQKMNAATKTALTTAKTNLESDKTNKTYYQALSDAVTAAQTSVDAYATAKAALDNRVELMKVTNFYTADASFYETPLASYNAGTLTDTEAKAFEDPYGSTKIAYHASTQINPFLGKAWGVTDYNGVPYVNTWSTEGDTDGSNFKAPFYEYWTSDAATLGDKTLTGTVAGLTANAWYKVTADVRVRLSNDKTAPATGITMQVGDGTAVTITGNQIGSSQLYLNAYTAYGKADADGNLTLKFNVASTNVSWLSFQHVKYEAYTPETVTITDAGLATYVASTDVDYAKDGLTAYTAKYDATSNKITLTSIKTVVPANTPVVLEGVAKTYTLTPTANGTAVENNDLKGSSSETTSADGTQWVLTKKASGVGFAPVESGETIAAKKAYLVISDATATAKGFIAVDGGAATGINGVAAQSVDDGAVYNVAGQKVSSSYKGLVIKNGKKYLRK